MKKSVFYQTVGILFDQGDIVLAQSFAQSKTFVAVEGIKIGPFTVKEDGSVQFLRRTLREGFKAFVKNKGVVIKMEDTSPPTVQSLTRFKDSARRAGYSVATHAHVNKKGRNLAIASHLEGLKDAPYTFEELIEAPQDTYRVLLKDGEDTGVRIIMEKCSTHPDTQGVVQAPQKAAGAKPIADEVARYLREKFGYKNLSVVFSSLRSILIMYLKNNIGLIETDRRYSNVVLNGKPNQYGNTIEFLQSEGFKKATSKKWTKGRIDATITKNSNGFEIEITE